MREQGWDIRLEKVRVGYGSTVVLSELDALFPAGKISVILGGSGCGKSTLLRHIAGLLLPLAGKTIIGGQELFALPSKEFRRLRRHMGMLFQDGALLGALTLAQNVALPLVEHTKLSKKTIHSEALRCLALVGLQNFGGYFPAQLSGGMRKRAGLARAIITAPRILLCDEPTSGLDPINAARMDHLLLDMKAHYPGMSLIVVSHDLASLARIADYVLVLHEGGAVFQGSYADLCAVDDAYLQSFLRRQSPKGEYSRAQGADLPDPEVQAALHKWLDN
ncbi:MAG: ATP-binding cassette domain-containing protein [Desulfovibrionaceae bacterium]|nr:ATP-binding cassette domain-containing protein [Desulfovibrionaceae bacterium]